MRYEYGEWFEEFTVPLHYHVRVNISDIACHIGWRDRRLTLKRRRQRSKSMRQVYSSQFLNERIVLALSSTNL